MSEMDRPPVSLIERDNQGLDDEELADITVETIASGMQPLDMPLGIEIIEEEDGGVILDFSSGPERSDDFYANLAEELDARELGAIASELFGEYESNRASRHDWEEAYSKGLELLGFNYEDRTEPFRGATGVTHPLLAEAAVQFQAQAFNEMLPSSGPVRTTILGARTTAKEEQSERVREFMNYYMMNVMEEYTPEFDQMLFYLPLAGSTFKKVYYDESLDRAVSKFVPAQNLVVPYEANDLETCPSITQVLRTSLNDLRKKQVSGFYRDVAVLPSQEAADSVTTEMDRIEGTEASNIDYDCTLLECHVDLDLPGYEDVDDAGEPTGIKVPYVVTLSEDNGEVLAIRRNYQEDDELKNKIQYFVHYKFLPGFGFYGLGLIHTIGGLSRTATAALRQLIDAGTLSNLPAGFKARGLRIRDDDNPLQPGEFRDVDAPGGTIRDSLMPLPFKGPDQTLMQLLGFVVEAGQRFATITDLKVGDGNQGAAVGTTIAMLEQGTRVMSAVHKRMHYAMRIEFRLLARIMGEYLPPEYPYEVADADRAVKAEDFDGRVDIVPVSNPNAFSQSQRIAIAQTEMQLAMQAPEIHNVPEVFRRMYEALGVRDIDKILQPQEPDSPAPIDPAQENVNAMEGLPLTAFPGQDHQAHIMAHMISAMAPTMQGLPKATLEVQKHVMEHVRTQAQEQAEAMFQQQNPNTPIGDPEQNVLFQAMKAQLIAQGLQQLQQQGREMSGAGEEQNQPDPLLALKQQELQIRQQKIQGDLSMDQQELALDKERSDRRGTEFQQRLASQERQTGARIDAAEQRELTKTRAAMERERLRERDR
tara:strand:- start:1093 stop:3549 length:2457 start_codon:yes stop_codon:yes gene_type:complete